MLRKTFPYYGLGFRVDLLDVPMIEFDGERVPDIDFNKIEAIMAVLLPLKPAALTGHEVRFLRHRLGLKQDQFGERLGVVRQRVIAWERAGDDPTGMEPSTEKVLRLICLQKEGIQPGLLAKATDLILDRTRDPKRWRMQISASRPLDRRVYLREILASRAA